jgi:hypothetical protein
MLMKWIFLSTLIFASAATGLAPNAAAQARPLPGPDVQQIYQRLLPQIDKIPAFDHHAHPGFSDDPDVDAMAAPPDFSAAVRTRDDNPELIVAAKALFGYPYADLSPEHAKWLVAKKAELKKQYPGTAYFDMILDKINTESSAANRAMMPDYLDARRFPWVFFVDSFMWPFNNARETARNPDEEVYIPKTIGIKAASRSSLKWPTSAPPLSAIRPASRPPIFTSATSPAAFPARKITELFRITFFAIWFSKVDGCTWPCIFTQPLASAIISTCRRAMSWAWKTCCAIRATVVLHLSCSTEAIRWNARPSGSPR